ncbi:protein argonaute PNH1 [Trifolium repens]|nr:protein argonaute PNH1 [Trifolium repens]KAK2414438.1 protein argonaute PNH1 [Trifolium repens]
MNLSISLSTTLNAISKAEAVKEFDQHPLSRFENTELGRRLPVYDGGKNLYTAGSLPFTHKEFNIVLNEDDEGASNTSYVSLGRLLYSLGRLL